MEVGGSNPLSPTTANCTTLVDVSRATSPTPPVARRLLLFPLFIAFALLVGAILVFSTPTGAAVDTVTLACPNKQAVFLTGSAAPPYESLIVYLNARPVGGGSSDQDGVWRIPLHVNEHPGIYNVEVQMRSTHTSVKRFTCYVDIPLDETSAMPTETDTAEPTRFPTAVPTIRNVAVTATATAITFATAIRTPVTTVGTTTATITATNTQTSLPAAAATATATAATATATAATATAAAATATAAGIVISDAVCSDANPLPDQITELVQLRSTRDTSLTLTGWKIINMRTDVSYTFPTFTLGPNTDVTVYSGVGTDNVAQPPDESFLYWGRTVPVWYVNDWVELHDSSGTLIDSFTHIPTTNCVPAS